MKILGLCGGYILPFTKNTNLDFYYLTIRWKNGVSMKSLILGHESNVYGLNCHFFNVNIYYYYTLNY